MQNYPREALVLGRLLDEKARMHGSKTFLRFRDTDLTYGQLDDMVNRVAAGLRRLGVGHGDKVALMLPNCPEFLYITFALAKLGAVEVPINTGYKGDLLEHVITSSDSTVLVVAEEWLDRFAAVEPSLAKVQRVIVHQPGNGPPSGLHAEMHSLRSLLDNRQLSTGLDVWHGDLQAIMYTSGTTGPSKGVMVSHAQACTLALEWCRFVAYTPNDVIYSPLPLFHGIAHTCGVVAALLTDSSIAIAERFSASRFWEDVRNYRATVAHGIFSMFHILLNQPPAPNDKDHTLRCAWLGQSAMDQAFSERFGTRIVETYGSTEVGIATGSPYGEWRPGSCGQVNSGTYDVRLVDDRDRELPAGETGEIVVRPLIPFSITSGYYNFPEATVETFRNLWFHTGDLAYRDKDGFFFFVDRKKDSIRRRGENIAAFDVERVLNTHPAVLESAVIAVPSELGEDEIKACIVLHAEATVSPEELAAYCDERIAKFMVPRYFEFRDDLPKTTTEKIEKYKLRAEGDRGITPESWDRTKSGA